MHYEHYTTLQQALNILGDEDEWQALSQDNTNFNKCDLEANHWLFAT